MNDAFTEKLALIRSGLYLPASNARAIAKAQGLDCDLAILDLEDSVTDENKEVGREAAIASLGEPWKADLVAIRVNGTNAPFHAADLVALQSAKPDLIVLPKVETGADASHVASKSGIPVLAMIETPMGVHAAREIASAEGVAGVIVGTNDLAAELRLPPGSDRTGLSFSLQTIVLAVRAAGGVALDGVYNVLDDPQGLAAECREGRALGFDGKTLIHPSQIETCNTLFSPTESEIEDALALIEVAIGGAERFRGRMIESMHVATARQILARARL